VSAAPPVPAERWALVTGGSRGIGRAVALTLAEQGWNVAVAYLQNHDAANEVAGAVRSRGRDVLLHAGNLGSTETCGALVERLAAEAGHLDGLVHAAALGALSPVLETRPGRWRLAWDSQVGALIDLVSRARRIFRRGGGIVALTSLGSARVMPGYGPIASAKGSLETLVRYLAAELVEEDINVNAVCGGPVDTASLRSFSSFDELDAESRRRVPGRLGRPEDLAPVVAFLLGAGARWIRGQVVVADGGFSLS
jgi:enoyl-[acyl-carrier protein] reductase III